ncbi:MAG: Asp-tRNA(Asn)/Glu-tRNA(Gln) amidotransferase subunit GatC [candidate division Zixibacteria bacterium]|nr:Asp-tRNA(Asn)/Glu-tRNA(Gln) amidotransferase subunit GatC [candidate division Zixibacteria bacterium]
MQISKEQIKHIAELARLKLTPREIEKYSSELTVILDYIDQLKVVDTQGVDIEPHQTGGSPVLRIDTAADSLPRGQVLSNAPERDNEYFRVPRVLDK